MGEQLGLERARSMLELARQLGSRPILEPAGSALERARQLGGARELGRKSRWIVVRLLLPRPALGHAQLPPAGPLVLVGHQQAESPRT